MGFAGAGGEYFLIIEEGLPEEGVVIHRILISITRENADRFANYIKRVLGSGIVIAQDIPKEKPQ